MSDKERLLSAYEVHCLTDLFLLRAPGDRPWMDATDQQFAYRCLPLLIANQAGWMIQNPVAFTACWNGGPQRADVHLDFGHGTDAMLFQIGFGAAPAPQTDNRITSHFGSGIVTISLPYLFRTPPGVNLWVKGPSNYFKDGAHPLEGIVEADWSPATFTMNWKLTRPNLPVRFEKGEPICMIVPMTRGLAESLDPIQLPLSANPELEAAHKAWQASRSQFLTNLENRDPTAVEQRWQKDYFQGRTPEGTRFEPHQTRVHLKEFVRKPE